jgi:uncharacterized membrane protein
MENQDQNYHKVSGVIFVGCMFLGMGIGMIFKQTGIGMFIGMGVGFLASGILKLKEKN